MIREISKKEVGLVSGGSSEESNDSTPQEEVATIAKQEKTGTYTYRNLSEFLDSLLAATVSGWEKGVIDMKNEISGTKMPGTPPGHPAVNAQRITGVIGDDLVDLKVWPTCSSCHTK